MRKVDQGDGTFREVKHCEPRYKSREIYDDKCDYEVNKWSKVRTSERTGQSLAAAPEWPVLNLAASCNRVGCERQGDKHETYEVQLKSPDGSVETCSITQDRWLNSGLGQRYVAKVRVLVAAWIAIAWSPTDHEGTSRKMQTQERAAPLRLPRLPPIELRSDPGAMRRNPRPLQPGAHRLQATRRR